MAKEDFKKVEASVKKHEISNLYYIYGQNVAGVEKLTSKIVKALVGDNEEFALTKIEGKNVDFSELYDIMQIAPMMTEYNCILINDYNCEKPREDMRGLSAEDLNKKLIDTLKAVPPQTVVILNVTGFKGETKFDFKSGKTVIKDRNKKLADFVAKNGTVCEFPLLTPNELSRGICAKVSVRGSSISPANARELSEMCLCDTIAIENEINKLCAYANGREITLEMLNMLVSRQNSFTVYNLAKAVVCSERKQAFDMLDELMADKKNRGAVLSAVTSAFLDLYRCLCAVMAGKQSGDVISDFGYTPNIEFRIKNSFKECRKMKIERLRKCIGILRDTAVTLNSTSTDEKIILEEMIVKMLAMK